MFLTVYKSVRVFIPTLSSKKERGYCINTTVPSLNVDICARGLYIFIFRSTCRGKKQSHGRRSVRWDCANNNNEFDPEQQDSALQFSFLSAQSESLSPVSATKELVQELTSTHICGNIKFVRWESVVGLSMLILCLPFQSIKCRTIHTRCATLMYLW